MHDYLKIPFDEEDRAGHNRPAPPSRGIIRDHTNGKEFGTRGAATANGIFSVKNLSLMSYYGAACAANVLGPGENTIYLVPQQDVTNNPEGLICIEANVKPVYTS